MIAARLTTFITGSLAARTLAEHGNSGRGRFAVGAGRHMRIGSKGSGAGRRPISFEDLHTLGGQGHMVDRDGYVARGVEVARLPVARSDPHPLTVDHEKLAMLDAREG